MMPKSFSALLVPQFDADGLLRTRIAAIDWQPPSRLLNKSGRSIFDLNQPRSGRVKLAGQGLRPLSNKPAATLDLNIQAIPKIDRCSL